MKRKIYIAHFPKFGVYRCATTIQTSQKGIITLAKTLMRRVCKSRGHGTDIVIIGLMDMTSKQFRDEFRSSVHNGKWFKFSDAEIANLKQYKKYCSAIDLPINNIITLQDK